MFLLNKISKTNKMLISFLFSFILIYYSVKDFNFVKFNYVLNNAKFSYVFIAIILLMIAIYLRSLRWKFFFENSPSINLLYKAQLIGYFGNNVLPLRMGEFVRAYYLGNKTNKSKAKILGTIILERIFDLLGCGFLLIILFNSPLLYLISNNFYYGILLIVLLGIIGLLFSLFINKNLRLNINIKVNKILNMIINGFSILNKKNIIPVIILTMMIWSIYICEVYLVLNAFKLELDIFNACFILLISSVSMLLPGIPGNFGSFEGSVVYALSLFNITDDFGFSFILHFISYLPYTIFGFIYFISDIEIFYSKKNDFKNEI